MIYAHEIPKGARLYFGKSAKIKRDIEQIASKILYEEGFEEIVTPLMSYHQHQILEDTSELIRSNDEANRALTVRADSTVDVVRLITNRLGRSTEHRKWFYIQPIYRFPAREYYQIGAEWLGSHETAKIVELVLKIFEALELAPLLQLSNIKIPLLLDERYGLPLEVLKRSDIDEILRHKHAWVAQLLYLSDPADIDRVAQEVPEDVRQELMQIKRVVASVPYKKVVVAPLYYAKMRYYQDLFFRFFDGNETLAMGGNYMAGEESACGFAIYTDTIIKRKGG